MTVKLAQSAAWVVATVLCSAALAARAPEKFEFTRRLAPGERYTFGQTMVSDSNMSITANGQVLQQAQQTMTQTRAGNVAIEAVDGVGKPTKATYTFDRTCGGEMAITGQPAQPIPSGLAGKAVTVTRTGENELKYSADVDVQSAAEIKEMFSQDHTMLPPKPLAVGETWDIDPANFKQMMPAGGQLDAKGTGKLLAVDTVAGRQVATIEFTVSMNGAVQGMTMKSDLHGQGTVDVATSQPIELTFSGPVKAAGRQQGPQGAVDIAVDGKMSMTMKSARQGAGAGAVQPGPGGGNPLAGAPDLSGTYSNEKLTLKLVSGPAGYTGTIRTGDKNYPITAATVDGKKVTGKFTAGATAFDFDATLEGDTFTLRTGGATHALKRAAAVNPLAQ